MDTIGYDDVQKKENGKRKEKSDKLNNTNDANSIAGQTKSIADDVKFNNELLIPSIKKEKKKRRVDQVEVQHKRLAEEEYNRQLHEQRYKRLMHLLNRSQFYSSYIVKKIDGNKEKNENAKNNIKKKVEVDENTPPVVNEKKKLKRNQNYDIGEYISGDVRKKLQRKEKNKLNLSEEEIEDELIKDTESEIKENNNDTFEIPKYFNGELRDYQVTGLKWLTVLYENGLNGILADEMGLGKTIQVIALICHLIEKKQDGPYLIIAPLSTIPNWMIEFEKFAPKLPVVLYHGKPDVRLRAAMEVKRKSRITDTYKTQPIVLTTFDVPFLDKAFMRSHNWRYIIIDEGHRIKNHECQLIKILKSCNSMNRLLLTGTPLQNNLAELWSLLNFLLPEIFDDLAVFEAWFNAKELQDDEGTKKFLKQEEEKHVLSTLREILQPFMLRREKSDVCLDIPPKKEVIVYAPLTELQWDLYKAVLDRDIHRLSKIEENPVIIPTENGIRPKRRCVLRNIQYQQPNTSDVDMTLQSTNYEGDESVDGTSWKQLHAADTKNILAWKNYATVTERNYEFFIRLTMTNTLQMYKKIVNHPYLVHCPLDATGLPAINEKLVKASGKLLVLDAMLAKLRTQGHKVLLFSTMTMILDMIEDYLMLRDYTYVRLDGLTKLEDRKEYIQKFNTDSNLFLFLISTRAGGVGLNLAAADTVIIYDSDWNPQVDIQAMARCHRIGQTRPVVVYRLCTKGTVDEAIISRADVKRVLEKMVISKGASMRANRNTETLLELRKLLESKDCQIVTSKNEVFTDAELNTLLDRSDLVPGK